MAFLTARRLTLSALVFGSAGLFFVKAQQAARERADRRATAGGGGYFVETGRSGGGI